MTTYDRFFCCFMLFFSIGYAETFEVTNTKSHGVSSFSWAVAQAEATPGPDTVKFSIPKSDIKYDQDHWTIEILEPLVTLSNGRTFIDGLSQSENIGNINPGGPDILIDGTLCPPSPGFRITSQQNTICGLAIGGFNGAGILITGKNARLNTIYSCFVGSRTNGIEQLANSASGIALVNFCSQNKIGIKNTPYPNILSGNGMYGLLVEQSQNNTILGNYIGTDITGLRALPNGAEPKKYAGLHITLGSQKNIAGDGTQEGRNIISGNYRTGIRIENTGSDSNIVRGNYIGLGIDGRTRIPNGEAGLLIGRGAGYNIIGGTDPAHKNVISGNHSSGIQLARGCYHNTLQGNLIGTGSSGIIIIPNDHNGIYLYGNSREGFPRHNIIGPDNVICGNGHAPFSEYWAAISIDNSGTSYNVVIENHIGINPFTNLQSGQPTGILIQRGAHHNIIGPGNTITNCYFNGVLVMHDSTTSNTITQNKIFGNQGKAIANLLGGNKELPPPTILYADLSVIEGTAVAGSTVEFYSSETGQARTYLGTHKTGPDGTFLCRQQLVGPNVVALAIDGAGNTSELSPERHVPVELAAFHGENISKNRNRLHWKTLTESNNLGFYILRKSGYEAFVEVAFVKGKGTTGSEQNYEYIDLLPNPGTYYYQLKQVDMDGNIHYSGEILIKPRFENTKSPYIYPNPFNARTRISFYSPKVQDLSIDVYNLTGEKIFTLYNGTVQNGWIEKHWQGQTQDGKTVPTGIYFIVLTTIDDIYTQKCMVVR